MEVAPRWSKGADKILMRTISDADNFLQPLSGQYQMRIKTNPDNNSADRYQLFTLFILCSVHFLHCVHWLNCFHCCYFSYCFNSFGAKNILPIYMIWGGVRLRSSLSPDRRHFSSTRKKQFWWTKSVPSGIIGCMEQGFYKKNHLLACVHANNPLRARAYKS